MGLVSKLNQTIRDAEKAGGWASYAVLTMGEIDSGDDALDESIATLYRAMEDTHYLANKLAIRYGIGLLNE